jgi:hypothetical protein
MRIFAVMLGFNQPEVIRGAFDRFQETVEPNHSIIKWFFDPGYPTPDKHQNMAFNKQLCSTFGWAYTAIENEGVLGNWNKVIHEHLNMQPGDFLFTYDPDVRMNRQGWIQAMIEALESDPKAMFCCSAMDFHEHDWMQKPPYNRKVTTLPSGLRISRYDCLIAWPSGMWRADFLITRDRNFGAKGKYYGWNEHADYDRLLAHGLAWISVTDYVDHHLGSPDAKYVEWKQLTANGSVGIRFEEWLNER